MDEVIYLESDEEITSVIDKLKALNPEAKAISLVIPKGAAILQSVVNLKLLQKEGVALSKDLSIVTQDRIGRNLASQAGFSVYDNINSPKPMIEPPRPQPKTEEIIELDLTGKKEDEEKAPSGIAVHRYDKNGELKNVSEAPAEKTFRPAVIKPLSSNNFQGMRSSSSSPNSSRRKKIILAVMGVFIVFGAVLFYIFYPKAIITLTVKSNPLEAPVEITVDNNIQKADVSRSAIPGELLEAKQQGGKKFPATGKKEIGEKAKGTVTTYNDSGESQKVVSGTEYKSDSGLTFVSTSEATIPGATASVDAHGNVTKISGKSDVSVESSESGDKYNIGPSNFTVAGKSMLSGKNSNPMSGGISREIKIVSQNDINGAKSKLTEEISSALHDELKKKAGKNKIYEGSIQDEVTSATADKKVGDEADEFEMKVEVKSSVIDFSETDYREMVVNALQKSIPANQTLNQSPSDEISISGSDGDLNKGIVKLTGIVKTHTIPKIDSDKIKNMIKGKKPSEAEPIIKETKEIDSVNIILNPSWLIKKIPSRLNNITIIFQNK